MHSRRWEPVRVANHRLSEGYFQFDRNFQIAARTSSSGSRKLITQFEGTPFLV